MLKTGRDRGLRLRYLANHMDVWLVHMERLKVIYIRDYPMLVAEVINDIKKLKEWRKRIDTVDPRRNREDGVPRVPSQAGEPVPESERPSTNDTAV